MRNGRFLEGGGLKTHDRDSTILKSISIPITFEFQHNYYVFIWTQFNKKPVSLIAYRDTMHNLYQINERFSVRTKRAEIKNMTNININTKRNVVYMIHFSVMMNKNKHFLASK